MNLKHFGASLMAASGTAIGIAAVDKEPHKYGIGLITGCVICYAISKVINFLDRKTD